MDQDQLHDEMFLPRQPSNLGSMDRAVDPSTSAPAMDRPRRSVHPPHRYKPAADGKHGANVIVLLDDHQEQVAQHSCKDNQSDNDYKHSSSRPQSSTKGRPKKVELEDLSYDELLDAYFELEQKKKDKEITLKDIRGKRTEDRKLGAIEKAHRIELQAQQKQLREENQGLRQKLARQKADFDAASQQQKNEFSRAQEDWIAKINMQKYPCLPDNILQNKFQELYNKCRDWARQWLEEDFVDDTRGQFELVMAQCCNPKYPLLLRYATRKFESRKDIAIRLMGFARLSRLVNEYFFTSPFSLFRNEERSVLEQLYGIYESGWSLHVMLVRELTNTGDPKKAYVWRAETVRLLRACMGAPALELRQERIHSKYLTDFSNCAAQKILKHFKSELPYDPLLGDNSQKPILELRLICADAALLSLEVFSQKSKFEILAHEVLCAEPFTAKSELHEPHMCMGHEEDDNSLDGVEVQMILVPALAVRGDVDGEQLDTRKIVFRSVILIDRDLSPDVLHLYHAEDQHVPVGPAPGGDLVKPTANKGADARPTPQKQRERSESSDSARKRRKLQRHRSSSDVGDRADNSMANYHSLGTQSTQLSATSSPKDGLHSRKSKSPSKRMINLNQELALEDRSKPLSTPERAQSTKAPDFKKAPAIGVTPERLKPLGVGLAALVELAAQPNTFDLRREERHEAPSSQSPACRVASDEDAEKAKVGRAKKAEEPQEQAKKEEGEAKDQGRTEFSGSSAKPIKLEDGEEGTAEETI
ncbi:hypothetical protein LTR70_005863 [Exophiala xenobiotica]|uniref:Uncharacterized protein n=1 Tax=Lithohypha guttulata TaxID=1690604 RepID=A0ABR0K933_9EURO|nr:hypothetical protein LTR24_005459 [Lithohypha guttulata]KAK5317363.1 hypothetical protein LTR70_005863 [Exophiala xenobiotica]